jgi:hypothetical protein
MQSEDGFAGQPTHHHGYAGASAKSQTISKVSELERLVGFVARAERIGDTIDNFLGRCRGHEGPSPDIDRVSEEVAGHLGQLTRLGRLLDRAEKLAHELSDIG